MQLAILEASYIGHCLISNLGYPVAGRVVSGLSMTRRMTNLKNRITGSILIAAGQSLLRFGRA